MNRSAAAIAPDILEEAADWLMRLHGGNVSDADRAAWEDWRRRSPDHALAWARAEQLTNKLGSLPPALAMPALNHPRRITRRTAIARLAALLAIAPAGWAAWRLAESGDWRADQRTATGERRDVRLADGSRVTLNTASAIDLRFDAGQRLVCLRRGEILVDTARDTFTAPRPFFVATAEGRLQALGTRFNVRQDDGLTRVAVLEGRVRVEPRGGGPRTVVEAGEQAIFTATVTSPPVPVDAAATAWQQGMLVADRQRLGDFAAELGRYRPGLLRVEATVADLPVSGAYPIASAADIDRTLAMLAATYPVEVRRRLGGYWVALAPR